MTVDKTVPANIKKKRLKLSELAKELCEGKWFNLTRLTTFKSLCEDPGEASHESIQKGS